ncbi:hypothetical protein A3F06_04100 [candidate division TM6 bacterium RIFCSPHIGHO2_12_FULL_36_22]|nr:MAG: hypothetical protein A3F06_04100 [candidate division TM6 bacterium RIFCSPHIGHO2_12_FULL_36_22]HLB43292.1 Maf family protein [Gammaproteobacteria bacterium]
MKKLYLGTQSHSRQQLLKEAGISFELVKQDANEQDCDWGMPLQKLLESIALHKMNHVVLPKGKQGDICWVLTADTMGVDMGGNICGKPANRELAKENLRKYKEGARTGTAVCIDRRKFVDGKWELQDRETTYAEAKYVFDVPDNYLDQYLDDLPKFIGVECTQVSGGVAIEGYGNRFLKSIDGSYTAVVGLPLYEVQQALVKLGFFE